MKRKRISTFIIALLSLSSLLPFRAVAQETENVPLTKEEWEATPLYQGAYIGVDVFGLGSKVLGGDYTCTEISGEVNLKNRYFPVIEMGYGSIETTNEETDIYFKSSAPYVRIGMNYNIFYKKPYLPGHFIVGLRYGFSAFSYDIKAPSMTDPVWGKPTIPFAYEGVKSNAGWLELVIGLRTNVYKNFYMGFSARYRSRMNVKKAENSEPYYIPGFGKNTGTNIGITYNLIYKLPF